VEAANGCLKPRVLNPDLVEMHQGWFAFCGEHGAAKIMAILRDLAAWPVSDLEAQRTCDITNALEGELALEMLADAVEQLDDHFNGIWIVLEDLVEIIDGESPADHPALHIMLDHVLAEVRAVGWPIPVGCTEACRAWVDV
jgi:hypothetical protein